MAVAAHQRDAGQRNALFRADDVYDALFRGEKQDVASSALILLVGREKGRWRRVAGVARDWS